MLAVALVVMGALAEAVVEVLAAQALQDWVELPHLTQAVMDHEANQSWVDWVVQTLAAVAVETLGQ
jgi:hypothetical protein